VDRLLRRRTSLSLVISIVDGGVSARSFSEDLELNRVARPDGEDGMSWLGGEERAIDHKIMPRWL
jgi:hypothetical protein